VVIALLILLYLLYLLYKWLKKKLKRKPRIKSQTVQPKPGSRKRTTVGVGEEVDLTYTGGITLWTKTAGEFDTVLPTAKVRWTAPDVPGSVTITAGTATITFSVLAPARVFMQRVGARQHEVNRPDTGVRMRPYLLPDNVNFYMVIYREMDVNAVATGVWACFMSPPVGHCGKGGGGAPCDDLHVSNKVVSGRGTETTDDDCAYSGDCLTAPPFPAGTISFDIPHQYRILGKTTYHPFASTLQLHTLATDGVSLSTEKDRARDSLKVSAGRSTNGCP
jgi:hypothetical protein